MNDKSNTDRATPESAGPAPEREHELAAFLRQDMDELAQEYARIFARTTEDPGTAGDEGEENWAELLRSWLPTSYTVVTKGRILSADGEASPQVDVVVLKPAYPQRLINKKLYLANGVAAAFECKTTLKTEHMAAAIETARFLRSQMRPKTGSPYLEITGRPLFGVLAHSHAWKLPGSNPRKNIDSALQAGLHAADHPRDLVDVVCVADLDCWNLMKMPYFGPGSLGDQWPAVRDNYGLDDHGGASTTYLRGSEQGKNNPVAVVISAILQILAWEDQSIRPMAEYFRLAGMWGSQEGSFGYWDVDHVYTPEVAASIRGGALVNGADWHEWDFTLP